MGKKIEDQIEKNILYNLSTLDDEYWSLKR